jgi:hypothetical protein
LWTELATNLFYLGMVGLGIKYLDLTGLGMAFLAMYLFHLGLMNLLARRLFRLHWSGRNLRLAGVTLMAVLAAFIVSFSTSATVALGLGLVLALAIGAYCLKSLFEIVGRATVVAYLQRIRQGLGCGRV